MKKYKSAIFGEIIEPETFVELMELVSENPNDFNFNVNFWRGQGDIRWPVHSGAYRRLLNSGNKTVSEKDLVFYETALLKRARHRGLGFLEGRRLNDIELLARLQHHGAATRFVDFSKNVLIALWFCVDSNKDKTGLLLGIHSNFVGGNEGSLEESLNYDDSIKKLPSCSYPFIVEPTIVSQRISAQHAIFLYSDVLSNSKGSFKFPQNLSANIFIAISPQMKKKLRKLLTEVFDIRTETIYPDLDGFSLANNSVTSDSDIWRW
ncbi:FRG domain-containing protein [Exiguobacterium aurantiacum]|uniref:FRG domain-containing protein n=1 Tax=Exiguobacterium aurantiacum TaxID=33987 RepID=UPI0009F5C299|nr:FRG domain-containing protein [Exiguobacterium aurantiacum]